MKHVINLHNVRWKKRYTYDDISKATGLRSNTIAKLFSGEYHDYQLSTLEKIAEFLGCRIQDILVEVEEQD